MKNKKVRDSFDNAWEGIKYTFKTQRNMRIHLSVGIIVVLASWLLDISIRDLSLIIISISLVLFAEMVNTAVEKTVDLFMSTYHPMAKIAKNVSAGAVLVAVLNAVVIGVLILGNPAVRLFSDIF